MQRSYAALDVCVSDVAQLDNRAMLQQFREALSTGGAVGPTGGLDATLVETEGLLSAIELATRLGAIAAR